MNNFAITSAGIGDALTRSASALYEAGNTIDESIALVTAANSVIQNPEQVGTALKTLALRLRGAKVELEEAGLETDNMVESTATLQAKLKALTHGKVDIMLNADTFKSTTQILREMAEAWEDMTDIERASALELMGGKRQSNILASVIKNFDTVEDVIQTSMNSQGSAMAENEKYLDSIQGKTDILSNSMQTLWNNALNSEFIKFLLDIANGFITVIDKVGLLNTALGALWAYGVVKTDKNPLAEFLQVFSYDKDSGFGLNAGNIFAQIATKAKEAGGGIAGLSASFKSLGISSKVAAVGTQLLNSALTMGISLIAGIVIEKAIKFFYDLATAQERAAERAKEAVDAYKEAKETLQEQKATIDELSASYEKLSKGVDLNTNENINLTTESYQEYLNICNDIADMYHELVTGYDAQGNAILSLKGNVDQLTQAYKEAAQAARQKAIASGGDIFSTFKNTYSSDPSATWDTTGLNQQIKLAKKLQELINNGNQDEINAFFNSLNSGNIEIDGQKYSNIEFDDLAKGAGIDQSFYKNGFIRKSEIDIETFKQQFGKLQSFIKATTTQINTETSKVKTLMDAYLGEDLDYAALSKKSRSFINQIVSGFNAEFINEFDNADALYNYIKTNIIDVFKDSSVVDAISDLYDLQLEFADGGISYSGYQKQLAEHLSKIQNKFDEDTLSQIKVGIGIDETSLIVDANHVKTLLNNTVDDVENKINSLSVGDLKIAGELEVPENTLYSWDELLAKIEDVKIAATSDFDIANYTEAISNHSAVISEYQEAIQKLGKGSFTMDDFMDLIKKYPDLAKGVDVSSNAFYGLSRNLNRAIKTSTKSFTNDLKELRNSLVAAGKSTDSIDQLIDAINNMPDDALDDIIQKYSTLAEKIQEAKTSQDKLLASMEENPNEGYETRGEALEYMKEAMEKGEIGSESNLWNVAEKYGFTYDSAKTINENADALAKFIAIRERWYKIKDDGDGRTKDGYSYEGTENFIKDVETAVKNNAKLQEYLAWDYDENTGVLNFDYNNQDWDTIVSILSETKELAGLTSDEFADFMIQVGQYFGIDWGNYDDVLSHLNAIATGSSDAKTKVEEYGQAMQDYFGENSDVDLTARPMVKFDSTNFADWEKLYQEIIENPDGHSEEDVKNAQEQLAAIQKGDSYATVYSSTFSNDDGTKSVVVTPILPDGKVLSPEQLEQYADKLLAGEELDPGVDIKLAEFDGSNSIQKANEYAKALHEAQAEYDTLRDTLNINTIIDEKGIEGLTEIENKELQNSINTKSDGTVVIDEEAFRSALSEAEYTEDQIDILIDKIKKLNSEAFNIDPFNIDETLISEGIHGLKEIQDLQGAIKEDAITGLTVVDADAFTSVLTEAGYTEQQIDSLIQKIKEYGNVVITSGNNDPLGLNATNMSIDTIKASLNTLGVEFTETYGRLGDGLKDININIPDLVSTLKASGWTDEAIKSYCAKLSEANIEGFQIKVNSEEVDNAIEKANEVPEEENTTYTVNGTGLQTLKDIKTAADNIPTSITTTHTTEEITVKKTVNEDEGFNLFKPSTWLANGTAHVQGSAFNTGSWGASKTETALVGELGPELLVRDGRWTTIGENGAEFTGIKKGDIIFNHKQTEELLKNGYVTSRGKAYASGTAYAAGGGTFARYEFSGSGGYVKYDVNDKAVDKYGDISGSIKKATAAADEFEDVIDWIEIRIEEINEQLDLMNAQLENAVGYSSKNNIIDQMLGVNNIKFGNLMAGIERYTEYISGLLTKIPAQYQEAAQNGAIAITEFAGKADEATVEAINNYREWAQKVADLKQQLEEVKTEIQDLAKQKFDNVSDEYDNIISLIESANEKLDAQVSLMEDSGYVASKKYYESMVENTKKQNEELEKEKVTLQSVLDEQVKLGNIKVGSEAWYEMVGALYEVDLSIMECSSELESFQNAINDIYWDNFDQLINRLDYLKDETQGLIDLMDSDDMVADPQKRKYENGTVEYWTADDVAWTDEGLASLGLYAQQMEIAEYKARQYAEAIDDLTKDFKDGKYSENEYYEKLNELTNAQYDSIEAFYEAQDAIKELNETRIDEVKNGIEKQINAYEELIEKQKEELNAEKDLHDFQKSITEQEKNISDIKRKLAAIENDNSISAAAQRKRLEAELAKEQHELDELYYDRSVEDKQTALDKELESFQEEKNAEITKWEEYLDNVETVVADSLTLIQANASGIYDTLNAKANEYDLTLSDAILTPWQDGALAVSDYQEAFDTAASSTMDQLEGIRLSWQKIIDKMNEAAKADIAANNKANDSYVSAKNPTTTTKPSTTTTNKPTSTSSQPASSASSGPAVGSSVTVKGSATHFSGNSGGVKMESFVPGGSYEVYQVSGSQVLIGRGGVYTGWVNKSDLVGYAKGTTGVKENQLAWIDELGEELIIRPQNGRMAFLEKGTGVVPANLTANLMEWGKLDPSIMLEQNRPVISAPQVVNNETVINLEYGDILHIDNFSGDKPEDLSKMIDKAFDKHMKELNAHIRRYAK